MNKKFVSVVLSIILALNCCAFSVFADDSISVSADGALELMNSMCDYLEAQTKNDRISLFHLVHSYMSTDAGVDYMISLVDDRTDVGGNALVNGYIDSFGVTDEKKAQLKFFLEFAKSIPTATRVEAYRILDDREEYTGALTAEQEQALNDVYGAFIDTDLANMLANDHGLNKKVIFNFLITMCREIVVTDSASDANDFDLYSIDPIFASRIVNVFGGMSTLNGTSWTTGADFMNILINTLNSSPTFTDALNASAKMLLGRDDVALYITRPQEPTKIEISTDDELVHPELTPITFTAEVSPAGANENLIEWYVNGVKQNVTGKTFTFTPPAYGDYKIHASVKNDAGETIVSEFKAVYQGTIIVPTPTPTPVPTRRPGSGSGGAVINPTANPTEELPQIPAPESVAESSYPDAQGHWAKDYIEAVSKAGILKGYEDGNIRPDFGVTREEMAVLLSRLLNVEDRPVSGMIAYDDNADIQEYANKAVYILSDMKVYIGYDDNTFRPQNVLTREEIMLVFSRILAKIDSKELTFKDDADISLWAYDAVQQLCAYGIVDGYPDGTVKPGADVTRAEAAVMIYKLLYRTGKLN